MRKTLFAILLLAAACSRPDPLTLEEYIVKQMEVIEQDRSDSYYPIALTLLDTVTVRENLEMAIKITSDSAKMTEYQAILDTIQERVAALTWIHEFKSRQLGRYVDRTTYIQTSPSGDILNETDNANRLYLIPGGW